MSDDFPKVHAALDAIPTPGSKLVDIAAIYRAALDRQAISARRWKRIAGAVAALAELPEGQREVVVLKHYEALSFEAMGRLLSIPSTTLKSRFAVAMAKLESALTARGLKPEGST